MKNLGLTFLFVASMATTASAQFGIEGGLNLANMAIKSVGNKVPTQFKTGGAFGLTTNIAFSDHVYLEPGLFFDMNGCTITGPPKTYYTIYSVTIPLNIEYKSGEKCSSWFIAGIGPYIARNIGGDYYGDDVLGIPIDNISLKFGSSKTDNFKALDLGFGVNMGYIIKKHLFFRFHYQMGLVNLLPNGDNDNSVKTSALGVTIGCLFGGCRSRSGGNPFNVRGGNHWRGLSEGRYSRRPHPARYPQ